MERSAKCSYVGCNQLRRRDRSLHRLPVHDAALCVRWLINCGREDLLSHEFATLESKEILVCTDHFSVDDCLGGGALKKTAVPFQYWDIAANEDDESQERTEKQGLSRDSMDGFTSVDSEEENGTTLLTDSHSESKDEFKTKSIISEQNGIMRLVGREGSSIDWCRTCATRKSNLVKITERTDHTDIGLLTKLKLLTEIEEGDVLPKKMCRQCVSKLEHSYRFSEQIHRAANILHGILPQLNMKNRNLSNRSKFNGIINNADDDERDKENSNTQDEKRSFDEINRKMCEQNIQKSHMFETHDGNPLIGNKYDGIVQKNFTFNNENCTYKKIENTVSALLTESHNNDGELGWLDVLEAMKTQNKSQIPDIIPTKLKICCHYCDSSFRLRHQLKMHLILDHHKLMDNMCENCNLCCENRNQLFHHHVSAHCKQAYQCDCCDRVFRRKRNLKAHIEKSHSKNEPALNNDEVCKEAIPLVDVDDRTVEPTEKHYTCNECSKSFSKKQNLWNHILRLHPPFTHSCTICNKLMHDKTDVAKHAAMHEKSSMFPCLECGRVFISNEKLQKHSKIHDNSESLGKRRRMWFHCQLCDVSFMAVEQLREHIENHTPEDWEKYRNKILYCGECNARLMGKEKFRIHKMKHHLAKEENFICLLCDDIGEGFQSLEDYHKHINLHCNELRRRRPRRYKCEHCGQAFKSNSHRLNHIDSFHSNVMHTCPVCGLKVKRKGNLKDHIDRVHNSKAQRGVIEVYVGDKRFPCRICGEQLLTIKERRYHEEEHEKPVQELEKLFPWTQRYTCEHCGNKFYHIHKLREHLLNDHGDGANAAIIETIEKNRKFKCTKCEATFKAKSSLYTHVKGVHSTGAHTCPLCDVKCKLASGLRKHLLTHNSSRPLYKCRYCEKKFKHDEKLRDHELSHKVDEQGADQEDSSDYEG